MLPRLCIAVLLAIVSFSSSAAEKKSVETNNIERLLKRTKNGTVVLSKFTTTDYNRYLDLTLASAKSRPYAFSVLFTARSPHYKCDVCNDAEENYKQAAKHIMESFAFGMTSDTLLFFAVLDIDAAKEIFQRNSINQAPFLMYFASGKDTNPGALVAPTFNELGVPSIISQIAASHHVTLPKMPNPFYAMMVGGVSALLLALLLAISVAIGDNLFLVIRNRTLWFVVSMIIYTASVGGMLFCIIKKPPMLQHKTFVSTGGRDQFILEGVMMGLLNVVGALALIGLYRSITTTSMTTTRKGEPTTEATTAEASMVVTVTGELKTGLQIVSQLFFSSVYAALFVHCALQIFALYTFKTSYYQLDKILPQGIQYYLWGSTTFSKTLPTAVTLLRRLVKLIKLWVYDYQGWNAFVVKAWKLVNFF